MGQRFFASVLLVMAFSRAQENVIVEEDDPRLVYNPALRNWDRYTNPINVDGTTYNNYFHGGAYLAIHTVNGSVSLTFNGSYIAYYGDLMYNHGFMQITLDGKRTQRTTYSATPVPQVKLFEATVDPNVPNHQITLTCIENGKNMGFDYFSYTPATPALGSTGDSQSSSGTISTSQTPAPPASGSTGDSQSSSGTIPTSQTPATAIGTSETASPQTLAASRSNTSTIVAAVFAGLGWALVLVLGALLIQLRRRRRVDAGRPPVDMNQMSHDQRTVTAFTSEVPSSLLSDPMMFIPPTPPITKSGGGGMRVLAPSELSSPSVGNSSRPLSQATESAAATHVSPPAYSHRG